jgi:SagB-type dehydrogenase family enzyme
LSSEIKKAILNPAGHSDDGEECQVICAPFFFLLFTESGVGAMKDQKNELISLPPPRTEGGMPLNEALARRESVRRFSGEPLTPEEISQLLWSAQGITRAWKARTAPSAGALYPLEIFLAARDGVFRYIPAGNGLRRISRENVLESLSSAALGQGAVREAPAVAVITAVYQRIEKKYGARGGRYVDIEAGHAAQNMLLTAVSLGLGAVPVGAFRDERIQEIMGIPPDHRPLYLIPVGRIF